MNTIYKKCAGKVIAFMLRYAGVHSGKHFLLPHRALHVGKLDPYVIASRYLAAIPYWRKAQARLKPRPFVPIHAQDIGVDHIDYSPVVHLHDKELLEYAYLRCCQADPVVPSHDREHVAA